MPKACTNKPSAKSTCSANKNKSNAQRKAVAKKRRVQKKKPLACRVNRNKTNAQRARNAKLRKWVKAAKEHGYLKCGTSFKRLPRKGTEEYKRIRRTYEQML